MFTQLFHIPSTGTLLGNRTSIGIKSNQWLAGVLFAVVDTVVIVVDGFVVALVCGVS